MPFLKAQKIENNYAASQDIVLFSPSPVLFWAIAFDKETATQVAENQAFKKEKQSKWSAFKEKAKQYKLLMGLLGFGAFGLLTKWRRKQLLKRRSEMSEGAGWCFGLLALFVVFGIGRLLGQYVFMLAGWPLNFFIAGFFAVAAIVYIIIHNKKSK
jgi:vacuolar-type H+-ATPase subunit I/STV1